MRPPLIAQYYTPAEAATVLGLKPRTVNEMAKRGEFPGARRIGKKYYTLSAQCCLCLSVQVFRCPLLKSFPSVA